METNPNPSSSTPKIIAGIVAVLVCCSCIAIVAAGALIFNASRSIDIPVGLTPFEDTLTPAPTVEVERPPVDEVSGEALVTLREAEVPENDPYELACRLQAICNVPTVVPAKTYQVGDKETFWVSNSDNAENRQGTFTLIYVTPHSYFWAEEGTEVIQAEVKALMDTFEEKIYPTDREFFGSEANPGVDNDPHIYVLYAHELGSGIGGYFSSSDSYNPLVKKYSNAHESYVMSSDQPAGQDYAYATLAHEFVHMIQDASDRNDVSWINEGFAELGAFLNGHDVGSGQFYYVENPDLQLNSWADNSSPDFGSHYGQSFLFLAYFLDRFGEEATKALTNNPVNDMESIDDTLTSLNITDPQTGQPITADDVFMDWAITLHLMDGSIGDGRFQYKNYPDAPSITNTTLISSCPQSISGTVNQYGIDSYTIDCPGDYTLNFSGSTVVGLLPMDAHSGQYSFWSNMGNESDMTLTREFDFTGASGPITLSYWTWYDIEEDWDYLYLQASTDGQIWEILQTPSSTDTNPSGQSYGWAYTGQTGQWIQEQVDLSKFAGQKVQLRFEYITDAAVNGEGLLLDDIQIDAVNYQEDFETDDGGWQAAGFVRIENTLPQTYRLSLITRGDTTTVTHIPVHPDQTASIPLSLSSGEQAVLIVTGTTRFTRVPAAYQIQIK